MRVSIIWSGFSHTWYRDHWLHRKVDLICCWLVETHSVRNNTRSARLTWAKNYEERYFLSYWGV